ncbi:MAG: endonuclease/exonuclease/phosphatase family protein [Pseudomonadota bacterium]
MRVLLSVIAEIARAGALLLALGCALLALMAQGGRVSDRLDVLTHFTPVWFAGAVIAILVWLVSGRQHRTTPVLALVALLSTLTLMLPEISAGWAQDRAPANSSNLKIVQFNVWGWNGDDSRAARWLIEQDADILLLEEGSVPLVRLLKVHYPYVTTCADPAYCGSIIFAKRKPFAKGGLQTAASNAHLAGAWATFKDERGTFTAVNVHYVWPYPAGPQQQQTKRLAQVLHQFQKDRLIVTGDFNSTPWSFALRRQDLLFGIERRTRALATWPATELSRLKIPVLFPILPIDHVYAGDAWRTVSIQRGPRLGSDHYPVIVQLARR